MSYLGLTRPILRNFLKKFDMPRVLEIGIDRGQTALPLICNLASCFERFIYCGVDIKVRGELFEQLSQLEGVSIVNLSDKGLRRDVYISEMNSLNWLHAHKQHKINFDLILLDGDHNYYTVSKELKELQDYMIASSIIVCDDYNGRYAETDMFYHDYEEYADNQLATKPIKTEKQGVKNAVRDFVINSERNLDIVTFGNLEPCIIYDRDFWSIYTKDMPESGNIRDLELFFDVVDIESPLIKNRSSK